MILRENGLKIYKDGREVCDLKTLKGRLEYRRRTEVMARRQNMVCCICEDPQNLMSMATGFPFSATFEHKDGRGMGGARRDDRIDRNGAAHYSCNGAKGSRRTL